MYLQSLHTLNIVTTCVFIYHACVSVRLYACVYVCFFPCIFPIVTSSTAATNKINNVFLSLSLTSYAFIYVLFFCSIILVQIYLCSVRICLYVRVCYLSTNAVACTTLVRGIVFPLFFYFLFYDIIRALTRRRVYACACTIHRRRPPRFDNKSLGDARRLPAKRTTTTTTYRRRVG